MGKVSQTYLVLKLEPFPGTQKVKKKFNMETPFHSSATEQKWTKAHFIKFSLKCSH